MRILPCGDQAVLAEFEDSGQVIGAHRALMRALPPGVTDLIPAARTVLASFDLRRTSAAVVADWLATASSAPAATEESSRTVQLPVRYDGADLAKVASLSRLSVAEVVARHLGGDYTVAFCGFTPGFAYLTGLDPDLHVARRARPRTRVPAGAVALADEFTSVYPRESPGGWQLIGHTERPLWDLSWDPPALLTPGTKVRFVEVSS
ncbi:MAG TPA: allophanate hydrolase subunit 1 [Jatrophihabitans sp.]|jgi:KipI family sensor histidine kinase inhibitor